MRLSAKLIRRIGPALFDNFFMQLFIYLQLHRALLLQAPHDLQFFRWGIKRITYKEPASWISMILFLRIFQFLFWGNEGYWKSSRQDFSGGRDVDLRYGERSRKKNCYLWSKLLLRRVLYRTFHIWVCLTGWNGLKAGGEKFWCWWILQLCWVATNELGTHNGERGQ